MACTKRFPNFNSLYSNDRPMNILYFLNNLEYPPIFQSCWIVEQSRQKNFIETMKRGACHVSLLAFLNKPSGLLYTNGS